MSRVTALEVALIAKKQQLENGKQIHVQHVQDQVCANKLHQALVSSHQEQTQALNNEVVVQNAAVEESRLTVNHLQSDLDDKISQLVNVQQLLQTPQGNLKSKELETARLTTTNVEQIQSYEAALVTKEQQLASIQEQLKQALKVGEIKS